MPILLSLPLSIARAPSRSVALSRCLNLDCVPEGSNPYSFLIFFAFLCSFFVLAYATDSRCVRLIKWSTIRSTVLTSNVCCLSCVRTHALLSSFFFIHTHTPHAYIYKRAHVPPIPLPSIQLLLIPSPFHSLVVLL